jgi:NAD(P)H-flavin reductase
MTLLTFEPPADKVAEYTQPGQYLRIEHAGESGYFVLASPPSAPTWSILLRAGGVADKLLEARTGDEVLVSGALGKGFPNAAAHGRALLLVVGGTGIAVTRAVVPLRIAAGDAASTELFLAFRQLADVPLRSELAAWHAAGVRVFVCLSGREPGPDEDPTGVLRVSRGHVQDVLRARGRAHAGEPGLVFVIGPEGLVRAAKAVAEELGVPSEDVHTNV